MFYTTHQMFLSRRAIYILIINMSQHIDDVVMDDEPYFDCSGPKSLRIEGKYITYCHLQHLQSLDFSVI